MDEEDLGFDPDDEFALFYLEPEGEPTPQMARDMLQLASEYRLRPPWWAIEEQVRVNREVESIWWENYPQRDTGSLVLKALGLNVSDRQKEQSREGSLRRAFLVADFLRTEEKKTGVRPPLVEAYATLVAQYPEEGLERVWERAYQWWQREFFDRRRPREGSE